MNTILTGAAFGAALTASGIVMPSVLVSQFKFEDWHMLQVFLTATASSALAATVLQRLGYVQLNPRNFSSRGWFAHYDGNLVGGALLGAGMALAGACPGSILAQTAVGIRSGYYALAGGVLAGIAWSAFLQSNFSRCSAKQPQTNSLTIQDRLGLSRSTVLIGFEALCAAFVSGIVLFGPPGPNAAISPVLGGLLIGFVQLVSLILRKSMIGVSSSYGEVGDWFWWVLRGGGGSLPSTTCMSFSLGLMGGAWALATYVPSFIRSSSLEVSPSSALLGGFATVLGARIAGGCPSGHGISGMSLFSVSSIITIGTALVSGAIVASMLSL